MGMELPQLLIERHQIPGRRLDHLCTEQCVGTIETVHCACAEAVGKRGSCGLAGCEMPESQICTTNAGVEKVLYI